VSTAASGGIWCDVGAVDIMMMHSTADIQGLTTITTQVLTSAATPWLA